MVDKPAPRKAAARKPRARKAAVLTVALAEIEIGERVQPLDEAKAQEIAASYEAHGELVNKIGLRHVPNGERKWVLVHGRHRLRALEIAGVEQFVEGVHFVRHAVSAEQARLMEIEENMARTDVSPFSRAVMLAAYREASGKFTGRGGDRKSDAFFSMGESFAAHAMRVFDLGQREVERLLQIGTRLTKPEGLADRLHFSKMARNQSQLLKLSALPEEQLQHAAAAFDAAEGDFFNLMTILNRDPAQQSKLLARITAGASLDELVGETAGAAQPPRHDHWQQAISAYSQLDFKGRVSATVEHFKRDEKAVREAFKSLGYELTKVAK